MKTLKIIAFTASLLFAANAFTQTTAPATPGKIAPPPVAPAEPQMPPDTISPVAPERPITPVQPETPPVPIQSLPSTNPNDLNKAKSVNPAATPMPPDTTRSKEIPDTNQPE